MALITNNHVIPTPQEASASRITFENVFPGRKCTLKGCDIFVKGKEAFRSSPDSKVCTHARRFLHGDFVVSYNTIILYSRDHKGLGVAHEKLHPKTSLTFP